MGNRFSNKVSPETASVAGDSSQHDAVNNPSIEQSEDIETSAEIVSPDRRAEDQEKPDQMRNDDGKINAYCVHQGELVEDMRTKLADKEQELVEIRQECEALKKERQENISEGKQQMDKEVARQLQPVNEELAKMKMLNEERQKTANSKIKMEEIATKHQDERKQLLREHELQLRLKLEEMDKKHTLQMGEKLKEMETVKFTQLEKELGQLQIEAKSLQTKLDHHRSKYDGLQEQNRQVEEQCIILQGKDNKATNKIRLLRQELEKIRRENAPLNDRLKKSEDEKQELQSEIKRLRTELDCMNTKHDALQKQCEILQESKDKLRDAATKKILLQGEKMAPLNDRLKKSEDEKEKLEEMRKSLENKLSSQKETFQCEIETLRVDLNVCLENNKKEKKSLQSNMKMLRDEKYSCLKKSKEEIQTLKKSNGELQFETESLRDENEQVHFQLKKLEEKKQNLEETNKEMMTQLQTEMQKLKDQNMELNGCLNEEKQKFEEMRTQFEQIERGARRFTTLSQDRVSKKGQIEKPFQAMLIVKNIEQSSLPILHHHDSSLQQPHRRPFLSIPSPSTHLKPMSPLEDTEA